MPVDERPHVEFAILSICDAVTWWYKCGKKREEKKYNHVLELIDLGTILEMETVCAFVREQKVRRENEGK